MLPLLFSSFMPNTSTIEDVHIARCSWPFYTTGIYLMFKGTANSCLVSGEISFFHSRLRHSYTAPFSSNRRYRTLRQKMRSVRGSLLAYPVGPCSPHTCIQTHSQHLCLGRSCSLNLTQTTIISSLANGCHTFQMCFRGDDFALLEEFIC